LGLPESGISAFELSWDDFDAPASDPLLALPTDARDQALLSRSNILKSLAAYDRAESDLRGEVARQFPSIIVSPGYTWERGLVKLPFSLGLVLPPLDFNRSAIAAAAASMGYS
jgi:CRISPR system Cascade subunit CasA